MSEYDPSFMKAEGLCPHGNLLRICVSCRIESEPSLDLSHAEQYWHSWLEGEELLRRDMDPRCDLGIVVPVYGESTARLQRQIDTLQKQQNISTQAFEITYVVNNDRIDGSAARERDLEVNARALAFLREDHGLPIHVVDKSSPGREILGCNVSKARNRGLAEMSLRFHTAGKNGVIIHTDADTWFEDVHYLSKVHAFMNEHSDCIAVAGGIIYAWSPDSVDAHERKILLQKQKIFTLKRTYDKMAAFLREPGQSHILGQRMSFYGANTIARSFESAVIGGFRNLDAFEDRNFGLDMGALAQRRSKRVLGAKDKLLLVTATRESGRTSASFKKQLDALHVDAPNFVVDVLGGGQIALSEEYVSRLKDCVRALQGGEQFVDLWEETLASIRLSDE